MIKFAIHVQQVTGAPVIQHVQLVQSKTIVNKQENVPLDLLLTAPFVVPDIMVLGNLDRQHIVWVRTVAVPR